MNSHRIFIILVHLVLLLALAGSDSGAARAAGPALPLPGDSAPMYNEGSTENPAAPGDTVNLYLPYLTLQQNSFASGQVTYLNAPLAAQLVELRYFNGTAWSTWATTYTDSNGYYTFAAPNITVGQRYYARWLSSANGSIETMLWFWRCNYVEFDSPSGASQCHFDVQNTEMILPASGSTVLLPYTFQWQARQTFTDSYEYDLFDPSDNNPLFYTPLLGYTNQYRLTARPSGFLTNTDYGWDIYVIGPKGYGVSHFYYVVRFRSGSPGGMQTTDVSAAKRNRTNIPTDDLEHQYGKP